MFENTTALILMVNLAEFGFVLYEDECTNRMLESLVLIEELANSAYFRQVPIFLVFNMTDYFAKELQQGSMLCRVFDEYSTCFLEITV